MYWFILIGAILILSIICIIIGERIYSDVFNILGGIFGIISLTIILGMIFTLINIDKEFEATINEYEVLKAQVECYKPGDYGNASEIMSKTLHMNSLIAKHKALSDSNWSGLWYSKEIGNLEPIILGKDCEK